MGICYNGNRELIQRIVNLWEKDKQLSFGLVAFKVCYEMGKDIQHRQKKKKDMKLEELCAEYRKESLVHKNKPWDYAREET